MGSSIRCLSKGNPSTSFFRRLQLCLVKHSRISNCSFSVQSAKRPTTRPVFRDVVARKYLVLAFSFTPRQSLHFFGRIRSDQIRTQNVFELFFSSSCACIPDFAISPSSHSSSLSFRPFHCTHIILNHYPITCVHAAICTGYAEPERHCLFCAWRCLERKVRRGKRWGSRKLGFASALFGGARW